MDWSFSPVNGKAFRPVYSIWQLGDLEWSGHLRSIDQLRNLDQFSPFGSSVIWNGLDI